MTHKQSKNPLTIYEKLDIPAQFKNEQLIHLLQKTPAEHIYTRPAKGGGEWDYVTGTYIKKVLNYAFGFLWSSEVVSIEEKYNQINATVKLIIHKPDGSPLIWKEDIGKKDIAFKKGTQIPLDYGNDKKAAVTDGLKRCASQFGIASDVYGKEEFKEIQIEKAPVIIDQPVDDGTPAVEQQKGIIKSLIKYNDLEDADKATADNWISELTFQGAAAKIQELAKGKK